MLVIIIKKLGMLLLSSIILLILTFWFYIRANNLGNQDIFLQFLIYLNRILRLDFGYSSMSFRPVTEEFAEFFIATFELCLIAMLVSVTVGLTMGCFAALHRDRWMDGAITNVSIFCSSIPIFWIAQLLISTMAVSIDWVPCSGRISLLYQINPKTGFILIDTLLDDSEYSLDAFLNACTHFLLPVFSLAMLPTTEIIRIVRNSLYSVMQQNYIKVAFSRGWSSGHIIIRHGLKNAMPSILGQCGSVLFLTFTSVIIVENVFNWPGIGTWIIEAIRNSDTNVVNAYLVLIGFIFVILNIFLEFIADLSIIFLNRYENEQISKV
jgi:cationic peptide transport system permease protein